MVFKRLVIAVCVFAVFAVGGLTAYQVADVGQNEAADESLNVTNETVVQQYDIYQLVDKAQAEFTTGFGNQTTVYNSSSVELTRGTDYNWNSTDGTIEFLNTSKTNETEKATVSYEYFENTAEVQKVSGPLSGITKGIGTTAYLAGGITLSLFLIFFGAFIASKLTSGLPEGGR